MDADLNQFTDNSCKQTKERNILSRSPSAKQPRTVVGLPYRLSVACSPFSQISVREIENEILEVSWEII